MILNTVNEAEEARSEFSEETIRRFEEACLMEEVMSFNEAQIQMFMESDTCVALVEAKKMRKNTIVRLSGTDDLTRRKTMAAMQLAKENGDKNFDKLAAVRVKERDLLGKILDRWGSKAEKLAKAVQKDYIKNRMKPNFATASTNHIR